MKKKIIALIVMMTLFLTPLAACKTQEKEKAEQTKSAETTSDSKMERSEKSRGEGGGRGDGTGDGRGDGTGGGRGDGSGGGRNKKGSDQSESSKKAHPVTIAGNKITDSAGRTVELPDKITKVSPSGNMAQILIYSIDPSLLVGWAKTPTKNQMKYVDQKYHNLPEFGSFFGRKRNMNLEAVIKAKPDVIIDVGQFKDSMKEDLDSIQKQTGIPTIFVHAELDDTDQAYKVLGKLLHREEQANKLAEYARKTLDDIDQKRKTIPKDQEKSFYIGIGEKGLESHTKGSIQSEALERVGTRNVCDLNVAGSGGGNEVSMEQIITWNPDYLILDQGTIYDGIDKNPNWKDLKAVKIKNVFEIPEDPYNWVYRPPSVNRFLGLKWAGQVFYPDVYNYDMVKEAKEFYKLFFHYDLTDQEAKELLKNSLEK